jgi:hypothetical protein
MGRNDLKRFIKELGMDGGYTWEDYFMAAFRILLPQWNRRSREYKTADAVVQDAVYAADKAVRAVNERKARLGQEG